MLNIEHKKIFIKIHSVISVLNGVLIGNLGTGMSNYYYRKCPDIIYKQVNNIRRV